VCVAVGNDSTVRLLLQRGASVQRPRALKHAIAHHRLELIELLAPGLTERSRDMYDFSPLRVAIESGNTATVQRVLSFPLMASEVNLVDANDGLVPLLALAKAGVGNLSVTAASEIVAIARLLLVAHADPDRMDAATGMTPLLCAVQRANTALVELLLEFRASVDLRVSDTADTALLLATKTRHAAIVSALLQAGANVHLRDAANKSPLTIAVESHSLDLIRMLLDRGAMLDLEHTPLSLDKMVPEIRLLFREPDALRALQGLPNSVAAIQSWGMTDLVLDRYKCQNEFDHAVHYRSYRCVAAMLLALNDSISLLDHYEYLAGKSCHDRHSCNIDDNVF